MNKYQAPRCEFEDRYGQCINVAIARHKYVSRRYCPRHQRETDYNDSLRELNRERLAADGFLPPTPLSTSPVEIVVV